METTERQENTMTDTGVSETLLLKWTLKKRA